MCTGEDFVSFLCSRDHIDHRADLLELLLEPFSIGCGHLRLMSMHPEEYGVGSSTDYPYSCSIYIVYLEFTI